MLAPPIGQLLVQTFSTGAVIALLVGCGVAVPVGTGAGVPDGKAGVLPAVMDRCPVQAADRARLMTSNRRKGLCFMGKLLVACRVNHPNHRCQIQDIDRVYTKVWYKKLYIPKEE